MSEAHVPLSSAAFGKAEQQALIAAVAEVCADPRPNVPYQEVRVEMLADLEILERQIASSMAA